MNIKQMTVLCLTLFLGVVLDTGAASAQTASFKVVVNASNSAAELTAQELSKLFLKKVDDWGDGVKVRPVDQKAGSRVRESFSQSVHGRGAGAIKSYWQQQAFYGRGAPPPVLASDAEVLQFVKGNRGAIGYVSANAQTDGVKVVELSQ